MNEVGRVLATLDHGFNVLAILLDGAEEVLDATGGPVFAVVIGNGWSN